ncbi:MAG TPA: glycosyltransferase [Terriglobales bacterium]|nr:glycosyltransferase [Terriglobales bacterium]
MPKYLPTTQEDGRLVFAETIEARVHARPEGGYRVSVLVPMYNERHLVEASLRRVLKLSHKLIKSLEVVVVDDCSTDGSFEILQRLAREDSRILLIRHERNQGKGAAVRTALAHATGEISIIHDADLEYHPDDIPGLLLPFAEDGADAVFGSRYLPSIYRRTLMYRHTLMNKFLTNVGNMFSDLNLSDIETGYKAINTDLLKSIPLRSNDFSFEVEVTLKLAKRRARIFEAPIRYSPRSYEEGKKIRARDGVLALFSMLRYWVLDDVYQDDEYGSAILRRLEATRKFNLWMGHTLRPYVGDRVLEIGAGIGNLTNQFIPRDYYVASDINPNYLRYLRSYAHGKPYLQVHHVDAVNPEHFAGLEGQFDTVLMINVLEHVADEQQALRNIYSALAPGGRAVILVPGHPGIYGTLDEVLGHRERYTPEKLRASMETAGFQLETLFDFNRFSVPGWWWNGKIFRKKTFSRVQLKLVNTFLPLARRIDRIWPWYGLSLIAIGVKKPR